MSAIPEGYIFGDFQVDTVQRTLSQGETTLALPSRAFDTLVYLIENRDRCVPKDEIIASIWQDVVVTDDSLVHAISVLRRALGDERQDPACIQTVPRRGYRFIAPISTVGGKPAAAATRPQPAGTVAQGVARPRSATLRMVWIAGLTSAAIASLVVIAYDRLRMPPVAAAGASVRLYQPAPPDNDIVSGGVLSPNGRYLAFVARSRADGESQLWLRSLNSDELRRLDRTAGASKPFWSPDSQQIGYFANGQLRAVDIAAGKVRSLATVFAAAGGSWGADDTILFAEWSSGVFRVPASGDGGAEPVVALDRAAEDIAYAWPQYFPDNRRFLYQIVSLDPARSGAYVGDIESKQSFRLLATESSAVLAPPHHLLHVENDLLIAEELDPLRPELTGRATIVARGVSEPSLAAENVLSASADLLAFQHGVLREDLAWFARDGKPLRSLRTPTALYNPRISPDGSRLIGSSIVTTDPGLWLVSLERDEYVRLETDAIGPVWSPDGGRVAFTSRDGFDVFVRDVAGPAGRRLLASSDAVTVLIDWTPDGTALVYSRYDATSGLDLWLLDVTTGRERPLLATPHSETQARISPDGNWIAYASDESGILETYVARFPDFSERRPISAGGGGQPQWHPDQSELYYLALDRTLMSVEIADRNSLAVDVPRPLFRAAVAGDPGDARDYFAVGRDGQQFLVAGATSGNDGQAITILVNWANGTPAGGDRTARASEALP